MSTYFCYRTLALGEQVTRGQLRGGGQVLVGQQAEVLVVRAQALRDETDALQVRDDAGEHGLPELPHDRRGEQVPVPGGAAHGVGVVLLVELVDEETVPEE